MSEDENPIDPEQIPDAIKAYKEQLDELREDMKIVVKYTTSLRDSVINITNQSGHDPAEVKRLREFRDKYQIRVG